MNERNKGFNTEGEWTRAETTLQAAQLLASKGFLEDANSRAYYAIFHATQAVLLTQAFQPKSHQGTLYLFNAHFVKTGRIPPEYSQIVARAAKYREEADYRHTMTFTKEQTEQTLVEARQFLDHMQQFLQREGY